MSGPAIAPAALGVLTGLARALCGDGRIQVVAHDRSVFDASRLVIGIDVDPASEPARANGLLAHECGHALISRYHLWNVPTFHRAIWFKLLNVLEDPRVDAWMIRRYAGSLPWFEAVARDVARIDPKPPTSLLLQFCIAAAAIDHCGWSHLDRASWLHPLSARVFDATRAMRRRYCETVPDPGLDPWAIAADPATRRSDGGQSGGPAISHPNVVELCVRRSAYAAWRIARDEILPAVEALIDRDVARIIAFAQRDAVADRDLTLGDGDARVEAVRAALDQVSPESEDACAACLDLGNRHKSAMRAFDEYIGSGRSIAAPKRGGRGREGPWEIPVDGDDAAEGETMRGPFPDPGRPVDDAESPHRSQVAALGATLDRLMVARRRTRWRGGFRSGGVPDLGRLMQFDADCRDDRVWKRTRRHLVRDGVLGLLIDLSASMRRGGRIEAAVAGTILFAEAASTAGIDFMIDGFQDVLIPIASIGERCTPAVMRRIEGMALEVGDRRPGGNNASRYNDDGPCLSAFADKLPAGVGRRNLVLVISDGMPEGRRSSVVDLQQSIARLSARPELTLIGLGLSDGTSHVRDLYPIALADVPVERLGSEIARILETHCRAP